MPHITGTCDCFKVKRLLSSGLKLAAPGFTIPAAKPEVQRRPVMGVDLSEGQSGRRLSIRQRVGQAREVLPPIKKEILCQLRR